MRKGKEETESRKGLPGRNRQNIKENRDSTQAANEMHVLCFLHRARPTTSSAGDPKTKEGERQTKREGTQEEPDNDRGGRRRAILSRAGTPQEIPDRVKIIARLFKHLTAREQPIAFCSLFAALRGFHTYIRKCGTHTRTIPFFVFRFLPCCSPCLRIQVHNAY